MSQTANFENELKKFNKSLWKNLQEIKAASKNIWDQPYVFPFHSNRGINHSEKIINFIEIFTQMLNPPLSSEEMFILISSAYLHDIGIQLGFKLIEGLEKKKVFELSNHDRATIGSQHAKLSADIIRANKFTRSLDFPLPLQKYPVLVDFIAYVCEKHKGYINFEELEKEVNKYFSKTMQANIRIPLLAALLQAGDTLDMAKDRIDESRLEDLSDKKIEMPIRILMRWWAFYYIDKVEIDNNFKIHIHYMIPKVLKENFVTIKQYAEKRLERRSGDCGDILTMYRIPFQFFNDIPPEFDNQKITIPREVLFTMKAELTS